LETPDANSADQDESKEKDPATQKKLTTLLMNSVTLQNIWRN